VCGSLGEPNLATVDSIEGTGRYCIEWSRTKSNETVSTCNKFVDEIRGLSDGLMVGVRWMEEVGERWGMGGFYVVEERKEAASQSGIDLLMPKTTPTPSRDGPVTASKTRFMDSSNSLNPTIAELPSSKDLLTISLQVTRWPVHHRTSVTRPLSRVALTSVVKLKPQSPKQLPNPQVCASCPPQRKIDGLSATSRPWSRVYR
jgi:hypothetical protein